MFVYYTTKVNQEGYVNISRDFARIFTGNYIPQAHNKDKRYTFKQEVQAHNVYEGRYFDNTTSLTTSDTLDNPEEMYHTFKIPKRTGGLRDICAPDDELKNKQTELLRELQRMCPYVHESAYAYVEGRSCKDAMQRHVDNKSHWYLKLDLSGFFPSCTTELVMDKLVEIYPFYKLSRNSKELIKKYCFKDGALPQGAPTSPYLSNVIMIPFDYALTEFCTQNKLIYTRYADDIIISSYEQFDWRAVQDCVEGTLYPGMQLNKDKTRYGNASGRNWNLGLMVTNNKVTVGNQRKRRLKQSIYNYQNHKDDWSLQDIQCLLGELQYVCQIEPDIYNKMYVPKFGDIKKELIESIKSF